MGKTGPTTFTTAQEADKLEALLSAAGLVSEQIDLVWDRYIAGGLKAAQKELQRMTTGFSVTEVERAPQAPPQAQQAGKLTIAQEALVEEGDRYEQAIKAIDAQQQKAFFDDKGRPRLVPEEMQRQQAKFDEQRAQHLKRFRDQAQLWQDEADSILQHTEKTLLGLQRRPVEHLTGDDLAAAAARDRFVERDTQQQSVGKLAEQVRAALARGDRVALALLATHLPQRLQAERDQRLARNDFRSAPELVELGNLVQQAEGALMTEADRQRRDKMLKMRQDAELTIETVRRVRQSVDPEEIKALRIRFGIR